MMLSIAVCILRLCLEPSEGFVVRTSDVILWGTLDDRGVGSLFLHHGRDSLGSRGVVLSGL